MGEWFLIMTGFWIMVICRVLNVAEYDSICLSNASVMPQYALISLSMHEDNWILDSWQGFEYVSAIDYVIALVMLQYSYNNIIIVTN